jgi:hypothetical protein
MSMLAEVERALNAVKIDPKDAGTAEIARHYARLIDDAAPAAKYGEALAWLDAVDTNQRTEKHAILIRAALAEHSVASDLGPKLLAALTALGATPAARKDVGGGGADVVGLPSPLQAARDAARERRAAAGDSSA